VLAKGIKVAFDSGSIPVLIAVEFWLPFSSFHPLLLSPFGRRLGLTIAFHFIFFLRAMGFFFGAEPIKGCG